MDIHGAMLCLIHAGILLLSVSYVFYLHASRKLIFGDEVSVGRKEFGPLVL